MKLVYFAVLVLVLSSCNPCKRLQRLCPPQVRDSVSYIETIRFDTVLIISPADTTFISVPFITLSDLGLTAENENQKVTAKVVGSSLEITAICKEDSLKRVIYDLEKRTTETRTIFKDKEVPVKYVPKFYKVCMWVLIALVLLTGVVIYFRIKGVAIKSLLK